MWSLKKPLTKRRKLKAWLKEGPSSYHLQYVERFTQLHNTLHWLLLISVLANTAPITILPGCPNRFYRLIHLIWMIIWYGNFAMASYFEFMLVTIHRVSLDRYLNSIESAVYVIHIFVIMLLTWQWRNSVPKVIESIVRSDMDRGYAIDYPRTKRFIKLQLFLVGIFTCLAVILDVWSQKFVISKTVLSINSYVLPNIMSSLSFIQYYLLLQGIAWRQRKVTENLEREILHLLNPRKAEVQRFRLHHADLTNFTRLVNRTFQYSIVLLFVGCFLNFNLVLFLVYQGIENPTLTDFVKWLYMLLWLAMHLGKVCSILYFNQKIQNEQSKCLTLLSGVSCSGNDLQDTINHFILQMRTNIRQHVVGGVIDLNLKYLTALLVASADFFIFLLQYDVTYEALAKSVQGNITKN
ncbi:putative gustatory receptor 59f [Drosophila subpulchrella]|uniref:putative gustatory receptor 59f n=1 Tax=Drosophila subpulchrella TaxID=1486046 RepID=UPI0018A137DB|nr:putative gustatory receptor 59f [Drosophila subpulchrella]